MFEDVHTPLSLSLLHWERCMRLDDDEPHRLFFLSCRLKEFTISFPFFLLCDMGEIGQYPQEVPTSPSFLFFRGKMGVSLSVVMDEKSCSSFLPPFFPFRKK